MTEKIPFHKLRFSVKQNEFQEGDCILIHVYAKGHDDLAQFIIPFKKMGEIKEFSDKLLKCMKEIEETYPEFAERNK